MSVVFFILKWKYIIIIIIQLNFEEYTMEVTNSKVIYKIQLKIKRRKNVRNTLLINAKH